MAVKDHTLDSKIITAAREEFLLHGFQKASLHKIAEKAGLTTGALYTRYKNKDALFCSLTENAVKALAQQAEPISALYYAVKGKEDLDQFFAALQAEMNVHLDVVFRFYDECVLLFCRSGGSSIGQKMEGMLEEKVQRSKAFLENISGKTLPGIEFILRAQFNYFPLLLEKNYSKEKTVACLQTIEQFSNAGWKDLFARFG